MPDARPVNLPLGRQDSASLALSTATEPPPPGLHPSPRMGHATPWEAIVAQPHLVVLVILLLGLHRYITQNWAVPHVELHLYQYNFLTTLGGPRSQSVHCACTAE